MHVNRAFKLSRSGLGNCGDIAYIWTGAGWSYLAVVLDLDPQDHIGWAVSNPADKELVTKALDDAWQRRGRPEGVMFHSDQGCQYTSLELTGLALSNGAEHELPG